MANFCSNCGKELMEGADVCLSCGKIISTPQIRNANPAGKSRVAAGLLGIFLGIFGVHNFYLGYNGKAIAQLLITVLSLFILSIVTWIWSLVEGIQILTGTINTDAQGNPLND